MTNYKTEPRLVAWEATRACEFACRHCRASAQPNPDPRQLTTQEAKRLVDQIAEFCHPIFIVTGGDPLSRPDIFEISEYATRRGLHVVLSPSGTNVDARAVKKMKDVGIRRISVSLDGPNPQVHDEFRGVPGAFEAALEGLAHARPGRLPFQINTTVTQHNVGMLADMLDLAVRLGAVCWDVFLLVPTGRGTVEMEISAQEYEDVLSFAWEAQRRAAIQVKTTCAPHFARVQRQQRRANRPGAVRGGDGRDRTRLVMRGCMAGYGFCFVSHIGEVQGCGYLPLIVGNVRDRHFKDIYQHAPLFEALREPERLKGKCGICEFRVVCAGCRARALAQLGDELEEEPYCTYVPRPRPARRSTQVLSKGD